MIASNQLRVLAQDSPTIELYEIRYKSTAVIRFCNSQEVGSSVTYAGNTYTCIPVGITGIEKVADGTLPRPVLRLGNSQRTTAQVFGTTDLVGAKITRIFTLAKYLDGGTSPSTTSNVSTSFYVEQKTLESYDYIEYSLATPLEVLGKRLPRRQVTRDIFPGVGRFV